MSLLTIRLGIFNLLVYLVCTEHCYWSSNSSYSCFGSKTSYDDVRGDVRDVSEAYDDCDAISIWSIIRHGTRHPGRHDISAMKNAAKMQNKISSNYDKGLADMCAQDIENLRKWTWNQNITKKTACDLTEEGYQELYNLGSRFQEKFSRLLEELDEYEFRPTSTRRTVESAKAFIQGLTNNNNLSFVLTEPLEVDNVLNSYIHCKRFDSEVLHGPKMHKEIHLYYESEDFKKLLLSVEHRLGLKDQLNPAKLIGFYELCRFERAYSANRRSAWCAVFSDEDLKVLEYVKELRHYYRSGYGAGKIVSQLGAQPLKDLLLNLDVTKAWSTPKKSFKAYFSHDAMLEMIYTALGMYQDQDPLTGAQRNESRSWRTCYLTPFAANIATVLYRCCNRSKEEKYKLQFLVNEREVNLCGTSGCTLNEFRSKLKPFQTNPLNFCEL